MKAILTTIGKNKPGIIAALSAKLADCKIDIQDISQTIIQGNFTMIMLVDLENSTLTLGELVEEFHALGKTLDVEIYLQHEDIFHAMHTV